MKKIKTLFLFILFFIVALIATLPAAYVVEKTNINSTVKMGNVQGPWWSFKVDWIDYKNIVRKDIKIFLDAKCLLTLDVCLNERDEKTKLILRYSLIDKSIQIENSKISFDLRELDNWTKNLLVKPDGSMGLSISSAKTNFSRLTDLDAELLWYSVSVRGENFDLGTLSAKIVHHGEKLTIDLGDESDLLDISGSIVILKSGLIDTNIELKVLSGFPSEVDSLLSSVMKKRGRFIYELKSKQQLDMIKSIGLF